MVLLEQMRRTGQPGRPTSLSAWSPEFWQRLACGDGLTQFLRTAHAPSTIAAYASQQRQFQLFCQMLGVPSPQQCFHPDVLAAWVMGRSVHGYKLSTIELGVHAVCQLARQHSHSLAITAPSLRTALRAAARMRGSGPTRKQPLLLHLLLQLCSVGEQSWIAARDSAFYALGWHGMLRGCEVLSLRWADVAVQPQGIILLIQSSKTDQAGQGQFVFLHSHADPRVCPVRCLHRLSCMCPLGCMDGPIFTTHQHCLQPVSKSTMLNRLPRRLQSMSLPHQLFGLHSLRSGGATAAAMEQVPERLIKVHGRWVSDTVRVYTCAVPEDRWATSLAMGASHA